MIFYFTGTGNSLAAAQTIARATDDLLVDIGAAYKYKDFDFTLAQDEQLGFVFPTYAWTTPPIVDAFIKRAHFRTGNKETFTPGYCFAVLSCGAFVGNTARFFGNLLLKEQGINLDASFSVKSVGNCTFLYAPAEGEKRERLLAAAELETRRVADRIVAREEVHAEHRNPSCCRSLLRRTRSRARRPSSSRYPPASAAGSAPTSAPRTPSRSSRARPAGPSSAARNAWPACIAAP